MTKREIKEGLVLTIIPPVFLIILRALGADKWLGIWFLPISTLIAVTIALLIWFYFIKDKSKKDRGLKWRILFGYTILILMSIIWFSNRMN